MTRGTEQSLNLKLKAKLSKIADNALLPRLLWDGARTYLLRMDVTHEDLQRMGPFINWGPFVAIRPHMQIRTYGTDQPNLHHFWWKEQAQYAIFEMGLKMTDKAVAMIGGNFPLDENIIAALPKEISRVIRADNYGNSSWDKTVRITAELADGTERIFFAKLHEGERARTMAQGEYESELAIFKMMPDFVPEPHAWGQCKEVHSMFFILKESCDMSFHLPEPVQFCTKLARLHEICESPTGKFGFHVSTVQGPVEQVVGWDSSWVSLFSKLIAGIVDRDLEANGPWKEFEIAVEKMHKYVIPRLLGALESEGRTLVPKLIHGNLTEENCGTSLENGEIIIFDACSLYAHSEMEVGIWRSERVRFRSRTYMREYLRHVGISEPADEFDDRNRLYSIKHQIVYSIQYPGSYTRQKALDNMHFLIDKYAPKEQATDAPVNDHSRV